MIERLKSDSGETISEVLVGVLIVGLATVLFATMINVATSTSLKSVDRTTATYAQLTAVDSGSNVQQTIGSAMVSLEDASDATTNVVFPNVTLKVSAISSTPGGSIDTTYTFTRYLMPDYSNLSEGD